MKSVQWQTRAYRFNLDEGKTVVWIVATSREKACQKLDELLERARAIREASSRADQSF